MGNISLEDVRKLWHQSADYPFFQTYEEVLEFEVDGVFVKAVATYAWRYWSIKLIEPYQIDGFAYGEGYSPPFFALGISMLKHRESLAKNGLTLTDESIRMATIVYRRHAAYLTNKTIIDAEQDAFLSSFREKLSSLYANDDKVQSRIARKRSALKSEFKLGEISQKDYQNLLKKLKSESTDSSHPYSDLKREVEMKLDVIKQSIIDELLANSKD